MTVKIAAVLFSVVFWNVENFFDYFDGGYSDSDKEFSSYGAKHWTKKRFTAKAEMVGKTILWAECPEVIGLAEVENDFVMHRVCSSAVLYKMGYRFVHFESRDRRGIDVALMYRPDKVRVLEARDIPIVVTTSAGAQEKDTLCTRDILYAKMESGGQIWHFFVNHHPSKYSGGGNENRMAAMRTLLQAIDSLPVSANAATGAKSETEKIMERAGKNGGGLNIVAMGDFNDVPSGEAFKLAEGRLCNKGSALEKVNDGSLRYHGQWTLIDNFLVSRDLDPKTGMEILRPPFLLERDRQWPGEKPKRCYVGPRYNGGVSDHLPVRLRIH